MGLFGVTDRATIRNLNIKNKTVEGKEAVGAVIGMTVNETFLINIHTHRDKVITQKEEAGGLVGKFQGLIFEATNESQIRGPTHIGGIVGEIFGEISHIINVENRGDSDSTSDGDKKGRIAGGERLGGIAGQLKGNYVYISNAVSSGEVTNTTDGKFIGGLFGRLKDSTYTLLSRVSCKSQTNLRGSVRGDYALGSIAGSVKASNGTYVDIKESYTECPLTLGSKPRTSAAYGPVGSNAGGLIGEIINGEVHISESYSNVDITNSNSGKKYQKVGGLIGSYTNDAGNALSITNSYHIGDIEHQEANEECGLLFGYIEMKADATIVIKNVYGMGELKNCKSNGQKAIFGQQDPPNINAAVNNNHIQHLYGYNDNLSNYDHCVDGSKNLGSCTSIRGFQTDLNSGIGAGKWQESASCTIYGISGSIKLPELKSNPQVAGPKCQ